MTNWRNKKMKELICVICGHRKMGEENENHKCENCGSVFFKNVEDIPEEDHGLLEPLFDVIEGGKK